MRLSEKNNLIFERMESGIDRERVQLLRHALDPNRMGVSDTSDSGIWRRRRLARAMVDAGLDAAEADLGDSDRIPLVRRVGDFLEDGALGTGTLVVRADEQDEVLEALGRGLDYERNRGWHDGGDMSAKARDLVQEINDLPKNGQTADV